MTAITKTSSGNAAQKATVLLTVKKVAMAIANASTVTKKLNQMFAENAIKTQFG